MVKLSAVVITLNEADNIARCLNSVKSIADEIVVVDSYSSDDTTQIAKDLGAKVIQNPFEGFIQQRKFSIAQAQFEHVLALDADEWLSSELQDEIRQIKTKWQYQGYYLSRKNNFGGKWIKYGAWYPNFRLRLFDRSFIANGGSNPHEVILPKEGAITSKLKGHLYHLAFNSIEDRYQTINNYTSTAALILFEQGKKPNWLKIIFKPLFRFISEYLFKLGFLDGYYGFVIAKSSANYVYLRELKLMELHRLQKDSKKN